MSRQRGFTLIEIMISLALVGMIMLLVFAGLRMGSRSWNAVEGSIEDLSDMRSVLAFMKRGVGNAYPLYLKHATDKALIFSGDRQSLLFVTELANMRGMGGYYIVSVDREDSQLRLRIAAYGAGIKSLNDVDFLDAHRFSDDIDALHFSYFGKKENHDEERWHHTWEKQSYFPQLVKMKVAQAGVNWPEFIMRPQISSDAACLWDNWHQRCIQ
ncbi:MAG: prepilin-type N-terminal cleavage/methylation domain-containing protein [Mariprofundaceae bacterium]